MSKHTNFAVDDRVRWNQKMLQEEPGALQEPRKRFGDGPFTITKIVGEKDGSQIVRIDDVKSEFLGDLFEPAPVE